MTKINNQGFDLGCFFVVLCAVTGKPERIEIFRRFGSMFATIKRYDIIERNIKSDQKKVMRLKNAVAKIELYGWRAIKLCLMSVLIELPQFVLSLPKLLLKYVNGPIVYILTWMIFIGGYVAVTFILFTYLQRRHPERKIIWRPKGKEINTIIIGFIVMMAAKMIIGSFITQQTANDAAIEKLFKISVNTSFMMVFMTAIAAPVVEELVFRGFLMDYFFTDQPIFAILLSGLIFGSIHASTNFISWLMYVVMGIILAATYNKEKNLAANISLHFLNNLLPSIVFLLSSLHQMLK
ncbi:MAG: CPBP family intramembrane glutamic endopeptidase [Ligilactobacillus ruminis]